MQLKGLVYFLDILRSSFVDLFVPAIAMFLIFPLMASLFAKQRGLIHKANSDDLNKIYLWQTIWILKFHLNLGNISKNGIQVFAKNPNSQRIKSKTWNCI